MIDFGLNQAELPWGPGATGGVVTETLVRRVLEGIAELGASRVRMSTQVGSWEDLDRAVNIAVDNGLKPLLMISTNPAFGYNGTPLSFANQCKAVASRYGPQGTNQVSEYELFNESNQSTNPPNVADGTAFAPFLKAGYTAIKSVHTSSTVIAVGTVPVWTIPWGFIPMLLPPFIAFGSASDPVKWYTDLYAAGAAKDYCDALGFHLYHDEAPLPTPEMRQWKYLTDVRQVMLDNNDDAKKIWVTEVGVGFPANGVTNLVDARDKLKILVEAIISYDYCGPFYVYNYKNYSGGDGVGGTYGMVDANFVPREPVYSYASTIAGTPSDPGDIIPPNTPTGVGYSDVTSTTAKLTWNPPPPADGVTNSRIYSESGVQLADTSSTGHILTGLPSGAPQRFYVTHIDQAGNESDPSGLVEFTTGAPTGTQADFAYDFTPTGSTLPTVFVQLGLGFSVAGGVALPNAPTVDGEYWTVGLYHLDQQSPDHSSRIAQASASAFPDRAALTVARAKPDGTEWIAAGIYGGGRADACRLYTCIGGVVRLRKAEDATPLLPGEYLDIVPVGNVYTVVRVGVDGTRTELLPWTDVNGVFAGAANRRAGICWHHKRVGGDLYPPPGITGEWKAVDVGPIRPSAQRNSLWALSIIDVQKWPLVLATGKWQIGL